MQLLLRDLLLILCQRRAPLSNFYALGEIMTSGAITITEGSGPEALTYSGLKELLPAGSQARLYPQAMLGMH